MSESTITTPEGRDSLYFEAKAEMKTGITVPVEVFIVYPEQMGLHGVNVARQALDANSGALFQELLSRNDLSVLSALAAQGVTVDYDDED